MGPLPSTCGERKKGISGDAQTSCSCIGSIAYLKATGSGIMTWRWGIGEDVLERLERGVIDPSSWLVIVFPREEALESADPSSLWTLASVWSIGGRNDLVDDMAGIHAQQALDLGVFRCSYCAENK